MANDSIRKKERWVWLDYFGGGRAGRVAACSLPSPAAFALCSQCSSCTALPSPRSRRHVRHTLHVPRAEGRLPSNLGPASQGSRLPKPPTPFESPQGQNDAADNHLETGLSLGLEGTPRQLKQRGKRRGLPSEGGEGQQAKSHSERVRGRQS